MRVSSIILLAALLALTACGSSSDRPRYSGHEESTAGVPGFSPDGKRKLHPTVKLGQSYTVGGKTYVPRYDPTYTEEGMASWYGPGFHGGRTANGEQFSTNQHTAAHTTLPMPSIVKVTHVGNGRSTYVRINDRGPFAHNRIIDLSKAAASDIGLIRDGVARVRVEYMAPESFLFAQMIANGRNPQSIDIASEVIGKATLVPTQTQYADTQVDDESVQVSDITSAPAPSVWQAASVPQNTGTIPVASSVQQSSAVIASPTPMASTVLLPAELPPANVSAPVAQVAPAVQPASLSTTPATASGLTATYVQIGAFSNEANATKMQQRVADIATTTITTGNVGGSSLYRVRMGPFVNREAAAEVLERAHGMGMTDAKLVIEHL